MPGRNADSPVVRGDDCLLGRLGQSQGHQSRSLFTNSDTLGFIVRPCCRALQGLSFTLLKDCFGSCTDSFVIVSQPTLLFTVPARGAGTPPAHGALCRAKQGTSPFRPVIGARDLSNSHVFVQITSNQSGLLTTSVHWTRHNTRLDREFGRRARDRVHRSARCHRYPKPPARDRRHARGFRDGRRGDDVSDSRR
jgi:hypothetical protein